MGYRHNQVGWRKMEQGKVRVIFVCMGNICRSPMAEAVFRQIVKEEGLQDYFEIKSAGMSEWHVGERPHPGTRRVLQLHNVEIDPQKRAAQVDPDNMDDYDYIIAMDQENVEDLAYHHLNALRLLEFAPKGYPLNVPDPYYTDRFEDVYQLVEAGARGLLEHIREQEGL